VSSKRTIRRIYKTLLDHFGPQDWWPGESPFEVMVGAVLTQNTNWKNVSRAIENLRAADVLDPVEMYELDPEKLAELIRPAGYFRLKTKRLRNLLELIVDRYDGDLDRMLASDLETLREELLSVNGIGPETADSILLYAGDQPTFVVDAYTQRVLVRHELIAPEADYHQIKDFFQRHLPREAPLYNEYHALLVRVGNAHCRRRPKCEGCPLEPLLPEAGPWMPED